MKVTGFKSHPYIPNSAPATEEAMLKALGLDSLEQLHAEVPDELILGELMKLPPAFGSEYELRRHVEQVLRKNRTCQDNLNFLGAGCAQHYVPAVCDEINGRAEFLTGYGGESYNEFGRFQSLFEYQSLMAELVDMEVVNVPTMDYSQAAATAIRMAARVAGRSKVLVSGSVDPEKVAVIRNYCESDLEIVLLKLDEASGCVDLADLRSKLDESVGVVYFENPNYLGVLEVEAEAIAAAAHAAGAQCVVGVDPISLGVLEPPRSFGADIVCGDLQPLGIHMNYGGGQAGFMATMDEEKYVLEYPSRLFGICATEVEGEYAFGDVAYDRTSFGHLREKAKEYVGTQAALWGITAGVYLSLMGPEGMKEVGETIVQQAQYAAQQIAALPNVSLKWSTPFFKEFVVDFSATGKTVAQINKELLSCNIFGGKDLSKDFPALGQCAMYCVTEIHTKDDLDYLASSLRKILA